MKFCNQCGTSLEDDAVFCVSCGATQPQESVRDNGVSQPVYSESTQEAYNSYETVTVEPKKKSKLPLILGIVGGVVALIAIIAVVLVFVLGAKSNSPEGVAKKFLEAYKKFDAEAMVDCIAYSKEYKEEYEEMKEDSEGLSEMGSMMEMDYKIKKTRKATSEEKEEFWEEAEDMSVMVKEKDVKDLRICEVTMTISAFGMTQESEMKIYVGKYKGDWKVISADE